jgi:hypothetical protein
MDPDLDLATQTGADPADLDLQASFLVKTLLLSVHPFAIKHVDRLYDLIVDSIVVKLYFGT